MSQIHPIRRALKLFLIAAVCLLATIPVALGFLHLNSGAIVNTFLEDASEASGCKVSVKDASFELLPIPRLQASNLDFSWGEARLSVEKIKITPDLLDLFKKRFVPKRTTLSGVVFGGSIPCRFGDFSQSSGTGLGTSPEANLIDLLPASCTLKLENVTGDVTDANGSRLAVQNLSASLKSSRFSPWVRGGLSFSLLSFHNKEDEGFTLRDIVAKGGASIKSPLKEHELSLKGKSELSWLSTGAEGELAIKTDAAGTKIDADISGEYVFDSIAIPFAVKGTSHPLQPSQGPVPYEDLIPDAPVAQGQHIRLQNLSMGSDSAGLDAVLYPAGKDTLLIGRLSATRVSLTRWLTFARWLCPGVQNAIDEINEAIIDFSLDGKGLRCPRVQATALGFHFEGIGGVETWKKPVVFLDLKSDFVDLGEAIPEAVGTLVEPPRYMHRPLTDMTREDLKPASRKKHCILDDEELDIGYDIRLRSEKVHYGLFSMSDANVVITPAGKDAQGLNQTSIAATTDLYGGGFKGECLIGGTHDTPTFSISGDLDRIDSASFRRDFAPMPLSKGSVNGNVLVKSKGKDIDLFLASLEGYAKAHVQKGTIALSALQPIPFKKAAGELRLKKAAWSESKLGLDGAWKLSIAGKATAECAMQGTMWFGGQRGKRGVFFNQNPATLAIKNIEAVIPGLSTDGEQGLAAKATATLNTLAGIVKAKDVSASMPGAACQGNAVVAFGGDKWVAKGEVRRSSVNLPSFLQENFRVSPDIASKLGNLNAKGSFLLSPKQANLKSLKLHWKGCEVFGRINADLDGKIPAFSFALHSPLVNLDELNPATPQGGKGEAKDAERPTDFSAMQKIKAKGTISCDRLKVNKLSFENISLPLTLSNGKLSFEEIRAKFYKGSATCSGSLCFGKTLKLSCQSHIKGFEPGEAIKDIGFHGIATGKADISSIVSADFSSKKTFFPSLNGHMAFFVSKGGFQKTDRGGTPHGKPTSFDLIQSSGTIESGVIKTQDFRLKNPNLDFIGKGTIDIASKELDFIASADMRGLPVIPMSIEGKIESPQIRIHTGKVFINTIGAILKGVFCLVGGLGIGAAELFR